MPPRWERARGLPASLSLSDEHRNYDDPAGPGPEESFPNLDIDGPSGVGLLAAQGPGDPAQYMTLDGGR